MFKKSRIYLDYAAATPLSDEAFLVMKKIMRNMYGNPSAIHEEGRLARERVESARTLIARTVQIKPEYVTFTSGGTEANNIAIIGALEKLHCEGLAYEDMQIITTRIEHPSVTKAFLAMKKRGVTVDFIAVDEQGQVVKEKLQSVLSAQTTLVSIAYANSEIGTVQSLHHIKKIIKAAETKFDNKILLHVDAAQAPLWLNCQFDSLGADLVSLDFAKCGGPKGVGALLRNHHVQLSPVLHGGGQEDGLRPGTENVLGIVGGAAAFAAAQASYKDRSTRVSQVRDGGIEILGDVDERVMLNGAVRDKRIANNINISIPGIDTEFLTVWLDSKGFAVSTKSACAGAGGGESTVVREISKDPARAQSTLRITLGPDSTTKQIEALALEMKNHFAIQSELTEK